MPFEDTTRSDETIEECLDELKDLLRGLEHYSPTVIALALHVHLETQFLELLEGRCSRTRKCASLKKSWNSTRCRVIWAEQRRRVACRYPCAAPEPS